MKSKDLIAYLIIAHGEERSSPNIF